MSNALEEWRYDYEGEGRRVRQVHLTGSNASSLTVADEMDFVYDAAGQLLADVTDEAKSEMTNVGYFCVGLLAMGILVAKGFADEPFQPDKVAQFLKGPRAANLTMLSHNNPFYLRGDFDADGRADYALTVRSRNDGRSHLQR